MANEISSPSSTLYNQNFYQLTQGQSPGSTSTGGAALTSPYTPGPAWDENFNGHSTTPVTTSQALQAGGGGSQVGGVQLGGSTVPISQTANGQYCVNATVSGSNGQQIHVDVKGSDPGAVAQAAQLAYQDANSAQAGAGNALLPDFGNSQEPQGQPMPGVSSIGVSVSDSNGDLTAAHETLNSQGAAVRARTLNVTNNGDGTFTAASTNVTLTGDPNNDLATSVGGAAATGTDENQVGFTALRTARAANNGGLQPAAEIDGSSVTGVVAYSGTAQGTGASRTASVEATGGQVENGQFVSGTELSTSTTGAHALSDASAQASEEILQQSQAIPEQDY